MKSDATDKEKREQDIAQWRLCASATSIVAGIFCAVVVIVLLVNYVQTKIAESTLEVQMEELKVLAQEQPSNERLLETIRQLDLDFRQNNLRRWQFSHIGAYMLLGGVVVLLGGLVARTFLTHEVPRPGPQPDKREQQIADALRSRWAVAGFGLVLVSFIVVLLAITPSIELVADEEEEPADPVVVPPPSRQEYAAQWYRFRGPGGGGVSPYTNIPSEWDGKSGKNVLWKSEVPVIGFNSPVVWGDRVFLSGGNDTKLQVFCYHGTSGELLWTGDVTRTKPAGGEPFEIMEDTGYAANTMVTDGRRAYAIFATGDLAAFDFEGKKVWEKSLGIPDNVYGYASSLEMYENLVIVQFDQGYGDEDKSRVFAFEGATGNLAWEAKRSVPNSWTSPVVVYVNDEPQLITVADPYVIAYNPADGTEVWRAECVAGDVAPSPIYAGGYVFAIEPYSQLVAIKPGGEGDVSETHIAWRMEEGAPDIVSPLSDGEVIYMLESEGYITCYDVTDGKLLFEQDTRESLRASPSLVGDRIYIISEEGKTHILEAGAEYKELGACELGEKVRASPAFADGRMYIRGLSNLYCISEQAEGQ